MSEVSSIQKILKEEEIGQWDIYFEKAEEYEIQLRNFDVEIVRGPVENSGYAVRVIKPKHKKVGIGIGTGDSLRSENIRRCLKTASIGASLTEFPGFIMPKAAKYPRVKTADSKIVSNAEAVVKDKAEELLSLLRESKAVLPTFGKIRTYNVSTMINNSEGVQAEKKETFFYIELALKAERGDKLAECWPMAFTRRAQDVQLDKQVPKWIKLAEDTLNAKVPRTMNTTVIFTPRILGDLLPDTMGFHSRGSSVFKGLSKFRKEEEVGSKQLTIYDDGTHDYALGSSPFDDEGVPQTKTTLVENGVCKNYIYDAMYAAAMDTDSTGNGQKLRVAPLLLMMVHQRYSFLPSTQPTNIAVKPGTMSLEEMIATTRDGICVEALSTMSSDSLTGSFGSEIRNAYLIEKGQLSTPLKGGQISGFVLDSQRSQGRRVLGLLSQVSGIGNEAELSGRCIAPHMRFDGVQVAGK